MCPSAANQNRPANVRAADARPGPRPSAAREKLHAAAGWHRPMPTHAGRCRPVAIAARLCRLLPVAAKYESTQRLASQAVRTFWRFTFHGFSLNGIVEGTIRVARLSIRDCRFRIQDGFSFVPAKRSGRR